MLKLLAKIGNKRPIQIITKSNQYPTYKRDSESESINSYRVSILVFDDMLGARNSSQIEFFTRKRHENQTSITIARVILVYQDRALEITVIEYYCFKKQ